MPLAVQFFDVVLWLHILAFFIAFGPTYAYGVFFAFAAKAGPTAMAAAARAMLTWDRIAVTTGALVLLVTGIFMTADRWEFSDFFVSWGFVAFLVVLGVTHGFFIPNTRRVIELLDKGQQEEAEAIGGKVGKVGAALGVFVILTVYVMTAKPFL
ncbi:MAG: DUF2269 family protein [Actinomycetota bacterium]|nr:DUF2269 family protein [Actinomycetota bacterium]